MSIILFLLLLLFVVLNFVVIAIIWWIFPPSHEGLRILPSAPPTKGLRDFALGFEARNNVKKPMTYVASGIFLHNSSGSRLPGPKETGNLGSGM